MPNAGDELHHFGWNACSSALCPWAPHPHVERRYLLVPGLRSSRIHVIDVKDDPRQPKLVKVIEPEEIAGKAGYSRPHTIHCGPDGIYVSALGNPEGDGPGGIFLLDHDYFAVKGQWEATAARRSSPTTSGGTSPRHRDHVRVGHAEHGRGRRQRRAAARQQVRPRAPHLGPEKRSTCRRSTSAPTPDGARAAPGARPARDLRLRRRRGRPRTCPRRSGCGTARTAS